MTDEKTASIKLTAHEFAIVTQAIEMRKQQLVRAAHNQSHRISERAISGAEADACDAVLDKLRLVRKRLSRA